MIKSSKPRYQRRFRFNAPMHQRQHFLHVHIDKALRSKLKIANRTVQVSKGDTVKVMSGSKRGSTGKVIAVDLRSGRIMLDSLSRKSLRGKELKLKIYASNVYITDLNLTDKYRAAKLKLAAAPQKKEEKAATDLGKKAAETAAKTQHHEAPEKAEQKAAAGL